LASTYFTLAETYSLSTTSSNQAFEYYRQAHDLFQQTLSRGGSVWDEAWRNEVELSGAHCSLRLGVGLLSGHNVLPQSHYSHSPDHGDDARMGAASSSSFTTGDSLWSNSDLLQSGEASPEFLGSLSQQLESAQQAAIYFASAVDVYRSAIENEQERLAYEMDEEYPVGSSSQSLWDHQRSLATALQNLGTATVLRGDDPETAVNHQEEALRIYQTVLDEMAATDESYSDDEQYSTVSTMDTVQAVSEVLMALADTYMQLGMYKVAKDRYQRCSKYGIVGKRVLVRAIEPL
jgi:tetratricopeptide (TPR) repeat protein